MSEKMRYHLKITDNQSEKVIHEKDVNAIIASVNSEKGTGNILIAGDIGTLELAATVSGTYIVAEAALRRLPEPVAKSVIEYIREKGDSLVKEMLKAGWEV